ncbi:hypothetical protein [Selenomonas ruminantium]|uniref:Serine O-acetyltransferase n=1 Tax=Selenomonas ruminantium TaxID=971 RepID=A0A1H0TY19_SELRU|nr:hypothetical protein [Selenomonas ruminantium]SDP58937.1 serine O-acetyltransferase [Selenomonas ruminantium]
MIYRFPLRNVKDMLLNQIRNNFFQSIDDEMLITKHLPMVLERLEKNISHNSNKYYYTINDKGEREPYFNQLHSCHWLLFLYLTANTIYKQEHEKIKAARTVCDKIYIQAKNVSACDIYYEVDMPDIFSFDHPTGSFMGRAKYGNFFSFTQGCSVECDNDIYPVIGEHVTMQSNSKIVGNSHIGDNCIIRHDTVIMNRDIPANSIVSGSGNNLTVKAI